MKKCLMIVAVALFCVSANSFSQDETVRITSLKYATITTGIKDGAATGELFSYPVKLIYTFSNSTKLRMSVYIPGSPYAFELFGLTEAQVLNTLDGLKLSSQISNSEMFKSSENAHLNRSNFIRSDEPRNINKPRKLKFGDGENGIVAVEMKDQKLAYEKRKTLKSETTSSIEVTPPKFEDPFFIHRGVSDYELNGYLERLKNDKAFPIWTSDVSSFGAGDHETTFEWDGYSNRKNSEDEEIKRLIEDNIVFYVLEDVTNDKEPIILDICIDCTYTFRSYATRTIETNVIYEHWVATKAMPIIAHFIVKDWSCNFAPYDALRGGVEGMMDFLNEECSLNPGVKDGVVAYATNNAVEGIYGNKGLQGTLTPHEVSLLTWQPVKGPNKPDGYKVLPEGPYYIMTVLWYSLDPEEYTLGQGNPLVAVYWDAKYLPEMELGTPTGISDIHKNEAKLVWEGNTPYFVANGEKTPAKIYDLRGMETSIKDCNCQQIYIIGAAGFKSEIVVR